MFNRYSKTYLTADNAYSKMDYIDNAVSGLTCQQYDNYLISQGDKQFPSSFFLGARYNNEPIVEMIKGDIDGIGYFLVIVTLANATIRPNFKRMEIK